MKVRIAIVLMLFVFSACKKEMVGGKCTYEKFSKEITATFIDGDLKGTFTISFQVENSDGDEVYRISSKQFKKILRNFDLAEFNKKETVYLMKLEEITEGSCVPFVIKEITIK